MKTEGSQSETLRGEDRPQEDTPLLPLFVTGDINGVLGGGKTTRGRHGGETVMGVGGVSRGIPVTG